MKFRVVPYKISSNSAKLLAQALSEKLGYKIFRGNAKANRINIPWGLPNSAVANKLTQLQAFANSGVNSPEFTTDPGVAAEWLREGPLMARTLLRSSGGRGAIFLPKDGVFCFAPLYTKYIPKKKEYRVHVIDNEVLLIQEKRKRRGQEADAKVRSHANGWVFCFNDIVVPEDLCLVALAAVEAVGHGGAVDIVWNERVGKCFALEVNSAPGLCPKSASIYAERIIRATSE